MLHAGNAIEVWFDKQHVGWMTNIDGYNFDHSHIDITSDYLACGIKDEEDGYDDPHFRAPDVETRRLCVNQRSRKVSRFEIVTEGKPLDIPTYARKNRVAMSGDYIFEWPFIQLMNLDEYEWLFDHPKFDPNDEGPEDLELRGVELISEAVRRSFSKKMDEMTESALYGGTYASLTPPSEAETSLIAEKLADLKKMVLRDTDFASVWSPLTKFSSVT